MSGYRVFPWRPKATMTESLEWKTDIIPHQDGSEQRSGIRIFPRQSFEVEVKTDVKSDLAMIAMAVAAGQGQLWGWPCWHEQAALSVAVPSGSSSIPVDTTAADYRAGGLALLWTSSTVYEVVAVLSVAAGSLSLSSPTTDGFPARSVIMPLRYAYISPTVDYYDNPTELTKLTLTITCLDAVDLSSGPSVAQYLALDVLVDPLLMPSETRHRSLERQLWQFDPGLGPWSILAPGEYPLQTTEFRWRSWSKASAWALRKWLHRRAGRLLPVWIPSWRHDLVLAEPVTSDGVTLTIEDIGYRNWGITQPAKQHVALIASDNSFVCRNITAAAVGAAGQEVLTLDAAPGTTDVVKVSYLALHRLAADKVELAWKRSGVAEVKASMVEVAT